MFENSPYASQTKDHRASCSTTQLYPLYPSDTSISLSTVIVPFLVQSPRTAVASTSNKLDPFYHRFASASAPCGNAGGQLSVATIGGIKNGDALCSSASLYRPPSWRTYAPYW